MIRDLLGEAPSGNDHADVCVIGAGAAGICLALELARLGRRVLLLEAGGREVEVDAQEPYQSEVAGKVHRGIHTGRVRALGGTTQRWGGQILELNPEDFPRRPWVPGSGWPFGKDELKPHYKRALALEAVDRSLAHDPDVWKALKLDMPSFDHLQPYFTRWCPEPSFARLHGRALEASQAIALWLHANAVELLLEGETVYGVRACARGPGGETRAAVFTADEYVFCLGAIECVRFFLQPRAAGLPWNRSGLLGQHFQDHIDVNVATVVPHDRKRFAELFDNVFLGGFKYHPKLRLSPAWQQRTESLNCAVTVSFTSPHEAALDGLKSTAKHLLRGRWTQVSARDGLRMLRHAPLLGRQSWRYLLRHRVYNPPDAMVRLRVHCEQEPEGPSAITLSDARDSFGMRRARLDWRLGAREMRSVRTLTKVAAESLQGIAQVDIAPELEDDARLAAACDDSNHHMGGMRMAGSEAEGVVDPNLRLHGTRNAYVCSGAVFPSSGFSNPTHTVIALAMRLAAHLSR